MVPTSLNLFCEVPKKRGSSIEMGDPLGPSLIPSRVKTLCLLSLSSVAQHWEGPLLLPSLFILFHQLLCARQWVGHGDAMRRASLTAGRGDGGPGRRSRSGRLPGGGVIEVAESHVGQEVGGVSERGDGASQSPWQGHAGSQGLSFPAAPRAGTAVPCS